MIVVKSMSGTGNQTGAIFMRKGGETSVIYHKNSESFVDVCNGVFGIVKKSVVV